MSENKKDSDAVKEQKKITILDNKYSTEDIERYGSVRFSIEQIALVLEVDIKKLQKEFEKKGDFYKAYQKGYLVTELKIREKVIKLADDGSTPAMNLFYEKIAKDEFSDI